MDASNERFVIFVEIVDSDNLEYALSSAGPKAFKDQVIRPVIAKLEKLCEEINGSLSNTGSNPFIIEVTGAKNLVKAADALVGGKAEYRINVPQTLITAGHPSIDFYVGIALAELSGHANYQGVTLAHNLAGGAGRNQIHVDSNVAAVLTSADLEALELILRGQQRLNEQEPASFVFQLLPNTSSSAEGPQKQEIVKLTLAVIDLIGSTRLKAMMGKSHQERLEAYEHKILDPFRSIIKRITAEFNGTIIDSAGDAFFLSFDEEEDARRWAVACLASENRIKAPEGYGFEELKYHFSIDGGKVLRDVRGNLQGTHVDRVHRLNDLSHEDQIILSPPVGAVLIEALTDPQTEGRVIRHNSKNLQGIVGETDIYEYCPPGVEPRAPREGKGGVHFSNYSLAAVGSEETSPAEANLVKSLLKRYHGLPAMTAQSGECHVYAFESVLDSARFLIEYRKRSPRSDRKGFRGTIHYGLLMEKEEGRVEGADLHRAQQLFRDCPDDAIIISNAARAQIHQTYNRWFKLQEIKRNPSRSGKNNGQIYRIIPKLPVLAQTVIATAAVFLLTTLGWLTYTNKIVDPQREKQAAFISLVPGVGGSSWFEEMPWFTPRIRLRFYEDRGHLNLEKLGHLKPLAINDDPEEFVRQLKGAIPKSFFNDSHESAVIATNPNSPITAIGELLSRRFSQGSTPEAVDWHLLGNLLGSLPKSEGSALPDAMKLAKVKSPDLLSISDHSELLDQTIAAYEQAIKYYKAENDDSSGKNRVLSGLLALCYSDLAQTYLKDRNFIFSSYSFNSANELIPRDAPLLKTRVLTLWGEGEVYNQFGSAGKSNSETSGIDYDKARFKPALDTLDSCGASLTHPLRALVKQRQAHYFLETWRLRETDKSANDATDIQKLFPSVANLIKPMKGGTHDHSSGGQEACMAYFRCQLLCALSAHFSGNNENAQTALKDSINYIETAIETAIKISDDVESKMWRDRLANFRQRLADHHLFAFGDVREALEQFKACVEIGKLTGQDDPKHPLNKFYLSQLASVAWMSALSGNLTDYEEARSLLQGETTSISTEDPYWLTLSLAKTFASSEPVGANLMDLLENAGNHFNKSLPSRDDRQLLLFICEYLKLENETGGIQESEFKEVEKLYNKFSDPWGNYWLGNRNSSYLKGLERSAEKVRRTFTRNRPGTGVDKSVSETGMNDRPSVIIPTE